MTETQKAKMIKRAVANLTIEPYSKVKKPLDHYAQKTRKALGVTL
jgi:hypothetical protein